MNKKIIIGFLILLVASSSYIIYSINQNPQLNNHVGFNEIFSFSRDTDLPDFPNSVPYYKVVNYSDYCNGSGEAVSGWGLPTDEEAILIANDYLISHDLLPEDAVLSGTERMPHVTTLSSKSNVSEEDSNDSANLIAVVYHREIDGCPIVGRIDFIDVWIGLNKEVIYCSKKWKELEEIGNINIIDAEDAYNKLLNNEIKDIRFNQDSYEININEISIGYYANNPSAEQNYYKPVWIFYEKHDKGLDTYFVVDACESE